MQRIRVGLTGLAVVLVLVMLATAVLTQVTPDAPLNGAIAATGDEPLADLGVAPGAPENLTNAVAPAPVAGGTR
ncbi:MAG: hypothetical protein IPN84_01030 [Sphingomonadales bacterium]|jgi:hypothetical protein|nr:hypothetical protein [Sphingomonadales bacterium]